MQLRASVEKRGARSSWGNGRRVRGAKQVFQKAFENAGNKIKKGGMKKGKNVGIKMGMGEGGMETGRNERGEGGRAGA